MKVADYVIHTLGRLGIDKIFVVYGAANGDLIDAFTRTSDTKYICTMHEQAGGFAAEGYAKTSGKFGVAISTSGPGGQNFVTPIANCFYDSVPCLFITGQVKTRFLRPNEDIRQIGFQETDIVSIVKGITSYSKMITNPNDIRYELEKALYSMKVGRPSPVLLDIPIDVQQAEINPGELTGYVPTHRAYEVSSEIQDFVSDYDKCKRPAVIVGEGARYCKDAVRNFIDDMEIPAFPTWNAIDIITDDFEYYGGRIGTYGGQGRNFAIQNCDLLLCLGTRLSGRITGGNVQSFARGAKKYVVDVDEHMLQPHTQQLPFDVNIHCDLNDFLCYAEGQDNPRFDSWIKKVKGWRDKYDPVSTKIGTLNPYTFLRTLSNQCTSKDVIVGDCGGNIVALNHAFKTKYGQRVFTNNGNSPMGFSVAGAIGAWFGYKDRLNVDKYDISDPVIDGGNTICIIGDGGMNMNIQELQTIKNYKIPVKIFILNNNIYGITKAFQEVNFNGRCEACGPKGYKPPDFNEIAKAYGIYNISINKLEEMEVGINHVLSMPFAVVCNVDMPEYHDYSPKIVGWSTPIEDMTPLLPRDEFRKNMIVPPLDGWETSVYQKD
jgi:acetolactate synthase-1/2/3 large subunit